jgi:hypothetical protein
MCHRRKDGKVSAVAPCAQFFPQEVPSKGVLLHFYEEHVRNPSLVVGEVVAALSVLGVEAVEAEVGEVSLIYLG